MAGTGVEKDQHTRESGQPLSRFHAFTIYILRQSDNKSACDGTQIPRVYVEMVAVSGAEYSDMHGIDCTETWVCTISSCEGANMFVSEKVTRSTMPLIQK